MLCPNLFSAVFREIIRAYGPLLYVFIYLLP